METRADANDSKKDGLFMPGKKEGWQQQTAGKGNEKRERGMILVGTYMKLLSVPLLCRRHHNGVFN